MPVDIEINDLLNYYPVLRELPPRLQHTFYDSISPIQADTGQVLFDVDQRIQSFLMLTQGSVRVTLPGRERELLLYRVQPGDSCILSISHLLGDFTFRAQARVEFPISGAILPQPLFLQMIEQSPLFCYFLFHSFTGSLTGLLELVERVAFMRLDERLARMLLSKGDLIDITHTQLADDLGSVREVISRLLHDFQDKGMIQLKRGQIRILDRGSLENLSRFSDPSH